MVDRKYSLMFIDEATGVRRTLKQFSDPTDAIAARSVAVRLLSALYDTPRNMEGATVIVEEKTA